MPRPTPKHVKKSRQRLNALNDKDRVVGAATLVLLVSFWLPWFRFGPISVDGLSVHGWLFIAMVDSIVVVLYVVIVAFGVGDLAAQGRLSKDQLLALITGVNWPSWCWASSSSRPASAGHGALPWRWPPPSWLSCPLAFPSSGPNAGVESAAVS